MDNKTEKDKKTKNVAGFSLIGVIAVWALSFFLFLFRDIEKQGQFGDMFGAVNALFSGLAFAGLILTLILQRKELALQREELQLTRDELKNQRNEFEQENRTLKYQRFENLFYNMLNLQQRIVDSLKIEYEVDEYSSVPLPSGGQGYENRKVHRELTGREVFRYTFEDERYVVKSNSGGEMTVKGLRNVLYKEGMKAYDNYWSPTIFDHYFRHLYKIMQFVDAQEFVFEEAYKYISFLRGTLSRHELVWIYYNALQPQNQKLKLLIEKYTFLKNLRPELLSLTLEADEYYKRLGFKNKDFRNAGFSSRDFEYYLTDNIVDNSKYKLSAFWNNKEKERGEKYLNDWNALIAGRKQ